MLANKKYRLVLVSPTKYNWNQVGNKICQGCKSPYDKSKAIYDWLTSCIEYDTDYSIYTADEAWETKKGVCQAYCELYYRIGKAVGLDVRIVSGISKNIDGNSSERHGWIIVNSQMDSKYSFPESIILEEGEEYKTKISASEGLTPDDCIFIDATWGAGSVRNGKFVKNPNKYIWFDVDEHWLIFTHFPENSKDQLLKNPISIADFNMIPYFSPEMKSYGFDSKDSLNYFISNKNNGFPTIFPGFSDFLEFEDLPVLKCLKVKKAYRLAVRKKRPCVLSLINNSDFETEKDNGNHWINDNGITEIVFSPLDKGDLKLGILEDGSDNKYSIILKYYVK